MLGAAWCQALRRSQKMAPKVETDVSYFRFKKLSRDMSEPYGVTPRGNLYILSFVDWLTSWPEAYAIPDKRAQAVSDMISTEIFPRYNCLQITDQRM